MRQPYKLTKVYIKKKDVPVFQKMFVKLTEIHGSKKKAQQEIGIANSTRQKLEGGELSDITARKILDEYRRREK